MAITASMTALKRAGWRDLFGAIHRPTGHPVLLTFLTGPIIQEARLWAAAANDALAAAQIASPHVQRFFEPVDLVSFKFLVGEDLPGETLEQRMAVCGPVPPQEACRVVRAAALASPDEVSPADVRAAEEDAAAAEAAAEAAVVAQAATAAVEAEATAAAEAEAAAAAPAAEATTEESPVDSVAEADTEAPAEPEAAPEPAPEAAAETEPDAKSE